MISTRSLQRSSKPPGKESMTKEPTTSVWRRVWGGGSLALACLASPCCAPLYVPVVLSLLAGTPIAAFLAGYVGWIYSAFTALSVVGLIGGGWLLLGKKDEQPPALAQKATPSCACQTDCSCQSATGEEVQ